MQVADKLVVSFAYKLTDLDGELIDESPEGEPLPYLHGFGNIIPGLEREMAGKKVGDSFQVQVEPAEGYGEREEELVQVYNRSLFHGVENIEVGMQFQMQTDEGIQVAYVSHVVGDDITLDLNHPLAGVTLKFDVKIVDIRDASSEELEHGHVHNPNDHHHHDDDHECTNCGHHNH